MSKLQSSVKGMLTEADRRLTDADRSSEFCPGDADVLVSMQRQPGGGQWVVELLHRGHPSREQGGQVPEQQTCKQWRLLLQHQNTMKVSPAPVDGAILVLLISRPSPGPGAHP